MSRSKMFLGLAFTLMLAVLAAQSFSQDEPAQESGQGRGPRGGQGGPGAQGGQMDRPRQGMQGQRDPEQMRRMMQERMMQRVKQALGATDEQWAKIAPPLEKVITLQRQAEGMPMGMGRGRMSPRPQRPPAPEAEEAPMPEPETKLEKARMELRQVLDGEDKEAVQKKLDAFRTARDEVKKELAAAQKALKETVTVNQEAELVLMGYLD